MLKSIRPTDLSGHLPETVTYNKDIKSQEMENPVLYKQTKNTNFVLKHIWSALINVSLLGWKQNLF